MKPRISIRTKIILRNYTKKFLEMSRSLESLDPERNFIDPGTKFGLPDDFRR